MALVVVLDYRQDVSKLLYRLQYLHAEVGMALHRLVFLVVQGGRLAQQALGKPDLAHVVQQSAGFERP